MPILLSKHAAQQLKMRGLPKDLVIEVTEGPDEILPSYRGRKLRRCKVGGKILEVVTKTEGSQITIVTAYYLGE